MIKYKDFVPKYEKRDWVQTPKDFQDFHELLPEINDWLEGDSRRLINIETVVLPNIHKHKERGSKDTDLMMSGSYDRWHQFVRVWYWE
ncbi:MAG: hypothetical protein AAFQ83_14150 [Bacteroidota bacterium]